MVAKLNVLPKLIRGLDRPLAVLYPPFLEILVVAKEGFVCFAKNGM